MIFNIEQRLPAATSCCVRALALLALIIHFPIVGAQVVVPPQSLESIKKITQEILNLEMLKRNQSGNVKIGRLAPDLQLPRCSKELEAFIPTNRRIIGNLSVGVRCRGVNTWTIYVPVRVGIIEKVVVASHALAQGHKILIKDVQLVSKDLANLPTGYLIDIKGAIGQSLRQPLTIGAVITPASIRSTAAIQRGDKVTILARRKGVEVRMPGIALADGVPGDRVKVRNNLSKEIIEGVITKYGEIKLVM